MVVLATLLLVLGFTAVILSLMSSQSEFAEHRIKRMRAYYHLLAGINLAREQLRTGTWTADNYTMCESGCSFDDGDMLDTVYIEISPPVYGDIRFINVTTEY